MEKIIKLSVVLVCFLVSIGDVYARCNPFDPSSCVPNSVKDPIKNSVSEGVFNVYLANNCSDYVDVLIEYRYPHSTVWNKQYYSFSPGENGLLTSTDNRVIYITAKSSKNSYRNPPLSWPRQEINMGTTFVDFTHRLTC